MIFGQLNLNLALGYERSDAFIVTAHPGFYKVLSPVKKSEVTSVILQNRTLVTIVGKLQDGRENVIKMVSIKPEENVSVSFNYNEKLKYFFIPLSPSFQEVELKIGEESYEVPAQRKEK